MFADLVAINWYLITILLHRINTIKFVFVYDSFGPSSDRLFATLMHESIKMQDQHHLNNKRLIYKFHYVSVFQRDFPVPNCYLSNM